MTSPQRNSKCPPAPPCRACSGVNSVSESVLCCVALRCVALCCTHRGALRGPGQEQPLVALGVGGVQAVEQVAWHALVQQGQHVGVVLLVEPLTHQPGLPQHQLFWRVTWWHARTHTHAHTHTHTHTHTNRVQTNRREETPLGGEVVNGGKW